MSDPLVWATLAAPVLALIFGWIAARASAQRDKKALIQQPAIESRNSIYEGLILYNNHLESMLKDRDEQISALQREIGRLNRRRNVKRKTVSGETS